MNEEKKDELGTKIESFAKYPIMRKIYNKCTNKYIAQMPTIFQLMFDFYIFFYSKIKESLMH